MKVLVLTTAFPRWKDDSVPPYIYELSKQLKNQGLEVVVLSPHHEGAKFEEDIEGLRVYRFPYFYPTEYQRLCYEGGIQPNLKRSRLAWIQIPFLLLTELIYAIRITRRERIDIIHSHGAIPNGFVGAILKRFWNIKHILTSHGTDALILNKLPLNREISSFIFQNTDVISPVCNFIKEKLAETLEQEKKTEFYKKVIIQSMGVDASIFNGLNKKLLREKYSINEQFTILFVGRFLEGKGIKYLLEAVKIVTSKSLHVGLILVGNGPIEDEIRAKVKELNLENYVKFVGWVNKQKLAELYVLSDLIVVPSIVTASGAEGLPTVIIEAMAAGKPVIASDVGGIKDVVIDGNNGFLVEEKNPENIAKKILELKNHSLYEKISKNALISGNRYDWTIIGKRYAELIREESWKL